MFLALKLSSSLFLRLSLFQTDSGGDAPQLLVPGRSILCYQIENPVLPEQKPSAVIGLICPTAYSLGAFQGGGQVWLSGRLRAKVTTSYLERLCLVVSETDVWRGVGLAV